MVPETMAAAVLTGHGGVDKIEYQKDVRVPLPKQGQVLVKVTATAKNNTDRKVREGLYVTSEGAKATSFHMSGEPTLTFPRIQGADVVGHIVAVGEGVSDQRLGERCLLDFNIYADQRRTINLTPDYFGHGADGGFAEYMVAPSDQFHAITNPELSDAELASMGMCSYQTGYHMLTTARVKPGEHILITGGSGGVGTALIQLCRLMGAVPHVISSSGKAAGLRSLGAATVIDRTAVTDWVAAVNEATGGARIDAVMDLTGGDLILKLFDVLIQRMSERQDYPRLAIAGASAGNITRLLWTTVYLYQIQIYGISHGTRDEAEQLINWIRSGALRPVLHGAFPLSAIRQAEEYFANQRAADYLGKIVIVPDAQWAEHGARHALAEA